MECACGRRTPTRPHFASTIGENVPEAAGEALPPDAAFVAPYLPSAWPCLMPAAHAMPRAASRWSGPARPVQRRPRRLPSLHLLPASSRSGTPAAPFSRAAHLPPSASTAKDSLSRNETSGFRRHGRAHRMAPPRGRNGTARRLLHVKPALNAMRNQGRAGTGPQTGTVATAGRRPCRSAFPGHTSRTTGKDGPRMREAGGKRPVLRHHCHGQDGAPGPAPATGPPARTPASLRLLRRGLAK